MLENPMKRNLTLVQAAPFPLLIGLELSIKSRTAMLGTKVTDKVVHVNWILKAGRLSMVAAKDWPVMK